MNNCGVFLWAFVNELWLTEKKKKKEHNGHFCGGITHTAKKTCFLSANTKKHHRKHDNEILMIKGLFIEISLLCFL